MDEQGLPKETHQKLIEYYGFDQPIHQQIFRYFSSLLRFDLGESVVQKGKPVVEIIAKSFLPSLLLGTQALFLAIVLGYTLGALHSRQLGAFSLIFIAVPSFILAPLLQYLFAIKWNLLPAARFDSFASTILPTLSLSLAPAAFLTRQLSNHFKEIYAQDYVLAARAKGLPSFYIFRKYLLKNATLPLLGYFGQLTTSIITGSFIVEKVFAIPGLGYWMVNSILQRDYPLIMGLTLLFSTLLLLLNFLFDTLAIRLDPRRKSLCA